MYNKFKKIISLWFEEIILIPLAFATFFFSAPLIRWIDPTAGIYDAGVLQVITLSLIKVLVSCSLTWIIMRLVFPTVWSFFQHQFDEFYKTLSPWQKTLCGMIIFFGFLFAFLFAALS